MRTTAAALLVTGTMLAGCGDQGPGPTRGGAREPLTPRAVAAVMLDHLPDDTSSRSATYVDEHSPEGLVGADLRYAAGEGDDGDLVRVTVSRERGPKACPPDPHCADLGDGVVLRWDEVVEEEDPGNVVVQVRRDGELVSVLASGPDIDGDPRELDIEPSVQTMVELVLDRRLRLSTDPDTVAAGEDLGDWDGGEVDPASLERVPNDDATIVVGWIWAYGEEFRYVGPSPYTGVLGRGTIGGRVAVTGEMGPLTSGFLDALAAPRPPPWLKAGCLPGYRCDSRNGVHLVWRPAAGDDPGDAFVVHVLGDGETVAFHSVGNRLGATWATAYGPAGVPFWESDLTDDESEQRIRLTTTRERFEQAQRVARLHD